MNIIDKIEQEQTKSDVTPFNVGDTVKVHCRVVEGGKERIQIYEGIVIARNGASVNASFTVRKISYGEGVERVFPVHTPRIAKIEVVTRGKVRRAKLHYLRSRIGKRAMLVKSAERIIKRSATKLDREIGGSAGAFRNKIQSLRIY